MNEPSRPFRVPLDCEVEFRRHADVRYRVDLIDFSPEGCCISPPVLVEVGERVWMRIPDMETIHAEVAWSEQWKVGLKFDKPFHPAVFENVVRRLSR